MIGLHVDFHFKGHGTFTGEVIGYDSKEDFGHRLLHVVKFTDGEIDEYPYPKIIKAHEDYLKAHGAGLPVKSILFNTSQTAPQGPSDILHTSPPTTAPYNLPVPASITSYPLRIPIDGQIVQGVVAERRVLVDGRHEWRIQLPPPLNSRETWLDTQSLHCLFEQTRRASSISVPARSTPELTPLQGVVPLINGLTGWTCSHPLVGTVVAVHTNPSFGTLPPAPDATLPKPKKSPKPSQNVTIEAAYIPSAQDKTAGAEDQFLGRLHSDLSLSVIFPNLSAVATTLSQN
jgi:hypothetical protein